MQNSIGPVYELYVTKGSSVSVFVPLTQKDAENMFLYSSYLTSWGGSWIPMGMGPNTISSSKPAITAQADVVLWVTS